MMRACSAHNTYRNNSTVLVGGIILIKGCFEQRRIVFRCVGKRHEPVRPQRSRSYQTVFQSSSTRLGMASSLCSELQTAASFHFNVVIAHHSSAFCKLFTEPDNCRHLQVRGCCDDVCNCAAIKAQDASVDELQHNLKSRHTDAV